LRTRNRKGVARAGRRAGGAKGASGLRLIRVGAKMSWSRKLFTAEGERKALLKDTRTACSGAGLNMKVARGENTGSSMLPNLSTRPPSDRRNLSLKYSHWK
jgi:hypothetical protein